jgi:hypothetical protein
MLNARKTTGAAIATAAALLFSTLTISTASAEEAKIECTGVNSCVSTRGARCIWHHEA